MKVKNEQTVVLIKPDGVKRGLIGEILSRFEKVGLKVVGAKLIWVDKTFAGKHYSLDTDYTRQVGEKTLENYQKYGIDPGEDLGTTDPLKMGKMVRKWNMDYISKGPVFAFIFEGYGSIALVRKMVGSLFPFDSAPGTIRGDYATDSFLTANLNKRSAENLIHASGTPEEAKFQRKLWFKKSEIYSY
ncbi:MAG: nucleoside-diphosphate kinase [Patescibacteria group bacterium]